MGLKFCFVAAALLACAQATDTLRTNRKRSTLSKEPLVGYMGKCHEQEQGFRMKLAKLSDKDVKLNEEFPGPTNADKRWKAYQERHHLLGICTPGTFCKTPTAEDITNYAKYLYDRKVDGTLELSIHEKNCFPCPAGTVTSMTGECVKCPDATYIDAAGKSTTAPLTAASAGKGKPEGKSINDCRCSTDKANYATIRAADGKVTCKEAAVKCSQNEQRGPCADNPAKECCTKCPAGSSNFFPGDPCIKCDSFMKAEHDAAATGVKLRDDFEPTTEPDSKLWGCKCKGGTDKEPKPMSMFGYYSTAADFPPPTHFPAATYTPWCMPIYPQDYDKSFNQKALTNPKLARAGSKVPSAQLETVSKQLGWNMEKLADKLWNPKNKGEQLDKTMKECPKDNPSGMLVCKDACTPKAAVTATGDVTEADVASPQPLKQFISCSNDLQVALHHY